MLAYSAQMKTASPIVAIVASLAVLLALAPLARAGMAEDCVQDRDLDLGINGCTAVISSGRWQGKELAWAYVNRGFAYLITWPAALTGAEHPEYPTRMDDLLRALGADPVDWSYKTECCSVALGVSLTPIALEMSRKVLENARECGAEAVVTMCPMCHMNLDARQPQIGLDPPCRCFTRHSSRRSPSDSRRRPQRSKRT